MMNVWKNFAGARRCGNRREKKKEETAEKTRNINPAHTKTASPQEDAAFGAGDRHSQNQQKLLFPPPQKSRRIMIQQKSPPNPPHPQPQPQLCSKQPLLLPPPQQQHRIRIRKIRLQQLFPPDWHSHPQPQFVAATSLI